MTTLKEYGVLTTEQIVQMIQMVGQPSCVEQLDCAAKAIIASHVAATKAIADLQSQLAIMKAQK